MTTFVEWAGTAQTLSLPIFLILLTLGIVLAGIAAYVIMERHRSPVSETPPQIAEMGYGRERWQRELSLWQGILRRLEIQAKYQNPTSERLQKEIAEAQAKIAEAERAIKKA